MPTPFSVERVVLINLKRRPDRLAQTLEAIVRARWPFPLPEILEATDGAQTANLPDSVAKQPGVWGCSQSHQRALSSVPSAVTLVLEDDVCFVGGFAEAVAEFAANCPPDWDGIMLGGEHVRASEPVNPHVVRCRATVRTHAYIVRPPIIPVLVNAWADDPQPCDLTLAALMFARLRFYAPRLFLCGTRPSQSDIDVDSPPAHSASFHHRQAEPQTIRHTGRAGGFY